MYLLFLLKFGGCQFSSGMCPRVGCSRPTGQPNTQQHQLASFACLLLKRERTHEVERDS